MNLPTYAAVRLTPLLAGLDRTACCASIHELSCCDGRDTGVYSQTADARTVHFYCKRICLHVGAVRVDHVSETKPPRDRQLM